MLGAFEQGIPSQTEEELTFPGIDGYTCGMLRAETQSPLQFRNPGDNPTAFWPEPVAAYGTSRGATVKPPPQPFVVKRG